VVVPACLPNIWNRCHAYSPLPKMSPSSKSPSIVNYNTIRAIYDNPNCDVAVNKFEKIAKALKVEVTDLYEIIPDDDTIE